MNREQAEKLISLLSYEQKLALLGFLDGLGQETALDEPKEVT